MMLRKTNKVCLLLVLMLGVSMGGGNVFAGSDPSTDASADPGVAAVTTPAPEVKIPPEVLILRGIERELKEKFKKDIFRASTIPSLVFTNSQYAMLSEARLGFNARIPTQKNAEGVEVPSPEDPNYRPPPSVRKLQLGGIVFNNPDEWTIYLNGKRVTPELMPSEAIDLRVYKDFIELRWFDVQTNKIFPVRLRANQTFNLDARIFLPG